MYEKHDMRYRYMNDAKFKHLVDMMESFLHQADFTPSEIREASMLASIHYESMSTNRMYMPSVRLENELDKFHQVVNEELDIEAGK